MWFQSRISTRLKAEGAETIDGLIALINARGPGWWKPIARIGEGKAAAIHAWLQKHRGIAGLLKPSAFHSDLTPVSYTHLDVYKRQALDWRRKSRQWSQHGDR